MLSRRRFAVAVAVAWLLAGSLPNAGAAVDVSQGSTTRLTKSPDGGSANGASSHPLMSANGQYVLFGTTATNLVAGGNKPGSYRLDLATGALKYLAAAPQCTYAMEYCSGPVSLSAHGRYAVMSNFPIRGYKPQYLTLYDLDTGVSRLITATPSGAISYGHSSYGEVSGDGRYVAFMSGAADLVEPSVNSYGLMRFYVRDMLTGITSHVSVDRYGRPIPPGTNGGGGSFSGNGRYVTFGSDANDIIADSPNDGHAYGYVRDLVTGATTLVTRDMNGAPVPGGVAGFNYDGTVVSFITRSWNVVPGPQVANESLFVRDLRTGQNVRASVDSAGVPAHDVYPGFVKLSEDGKQILFTSSSDELDHQTLGDSSTDLFVHRFDTGLTVRATLAGDGSAGSRSLDGHGMSADGGRVVFANYWDNITPGDTNYGYDIFLRTYPGATFTTRTPREIELPPPATPPAIGWQGVGGSITGAPSLVGPWSQGFFTVVARGRDNGVWIGNTWLDWWSNWSSLGGQTFSSPTIAFRPSGQFDIFAQGTDNRIWQRSARAFEGFNDQWTPLSSGLTNEAPAAVSWGGDRIDLFARGLDNQLWLRTLVGSLWSEWRPLGGILSSGPAVTSFGPGNLEVVARGADGAVWSKSFNGTWGPWVGVGGQTPGQPSIVALPDGRLEVFAQGTNGVVYAAHRTVGVWSGWRSLGRFTYGPPGATLTSTSPIVVDVATVDANGGLWFTHLGEAQL